MPKTLDMMTKAEIERAYERTKAAHYGVVDALIADRRGDQTGRQLRKLRDPLSLRYIETWDAFDAVIVEQERRKRYHGSLHRIRA